MDEVAELKRRLLRTEALLTRWLIFKQHLFRGGDGKGGSNYYGPVADTEAYFREGRPDYDIYDPSKLLQSPTLF